MSGTHPAWSARQGVPCSERNLHLQDVVEEYKTLEGHKDDILAMDAFLDHALLATGDYEGRINVWNINSGERRMSMFHKADRFENSVEALQWLPISSDVPEGRHIAPMLLLSSGADSIIRVWHVGAVGSLLCTLQGATGGILPPALLYTPASPVES